LFLSAVKVYDVVVAMTGGGPGIASEVPAKFILDYLFGRANLGLASAASTVLLITAAAVLAPWMYARSRLERVRAPIPAVPLAAGAAPRDKVQA
jgi:glucose/mannose transport system permease protein